MPLKSLTVVQTSGDLSVWRLYTYHARSHRSTSLRSHTYYYHLPPVAQVTPDWPARSPINILQLIRTLKYALCEYVSPQFILQFTLASDVGDCRTKPDLLEATKFPTAGETQQPDKKWEEAETIRQHNDERTSPPFLCWSF